MENIWEVKFEFGEPIKAGSAAALIKLLDADSSYWAGLDSGYLYKKYGVLGYDKLIDTVRASEREGQKSATFDIAGQRGLYIMPPVKSIEGLLLRSLHDQGKRKLATGLTTYFFFENRWFSHTNLTDFLHNPELAEAMTAEACLAAARALPRIVPASAVAAKLDDVARRASTAALELEAQLDTLRAQAAAAEHSIGAHAARVTLRRGAAMSVMRKRLSELRNRQTEETKRWEEEFERIRQVYTQQLQYRAPVALWKDQEKTHSGRARTAFGWFVVLAILCVATGGIIAIWFGDSVAHAFLRQVCVDQGPCTEAFSPKGPLLVGMLLLGASIWIWGLRFVSKIFLSERHLALAAAEKKAFAETYLALVQDQSVSRDQEAIVLGSLFRPTQDGVIKDDDGTLDISAAAILAKAISGGRTT